MKSVKSTEKSQGSLYKVLKEVQDGVAIRIKCSDCSAAVLMLEEKCIKATKGRRKATIAGMRQIIGEGLHLGAASFNREGAHGRFYFADYE